MKESGGAEEMPTYARLSAIESLIDVRRPWEAIRLATEGLASDPGNPRLLAAKGRAHLEAGQIDEARTWLRRALEHDPDDGWVHHLLADALLETPIDHRAALRSAEEAVRRSPSNPAYLYNVVRAHLTKNRLGRATTAAKAIREAAPTSYLGPLSDALIALGRVERLKTWAISFGAGILGATRGTGVLLLPFVWLGFVLLRSRHLRQADELIRETLSRHPTDTSVRLIGSDILVQRFRFGESVDFQVTAAALDIGAVSASQLAGSIAERVAHAILASAVTWAAVVIIISQATQSPVATVATTLALAAAIIPAILKFDRSQTRALPPLVLERTLLNPAPLSAAGVTTFIAALAGSQVIRDGQSASAFSAYLAVLLASPIWAGLAGHLFLRSRRVGQS